MRVAMAAAMLRSKDPKTQVGACIADRKPPHPVGRATTARPPALDDDEFPWESAGRARCTDKHSYVIHAEANAILNYRGSNKDLAGATIYVTLFPCHECAKTLAQAGIGEVVYLDDKYHSTEDGLVSQATSSTRCGISLPPGGRGNRGLTPQTRIAAGLRGLEAGYTYPC